MRKVMERAPEEHAKIPLKNFLRDLTDNLCIMYKEGEKILLHPPFLPGVFYGCVFCIRV